MDGEKFKPIGSAVAGGIALLVVEILKVFYSLIVSAGHTGFMGGISYLTSGFFIKSIIFSFITGFIGGGLYALVYNWADK